MFGRGMFRPGGSSGRNKELSWQRWAEMVNATDHAGSRNRYLQWRRLIVGALISAAIASLVSMLRANSQRRDQPGARQRDEPKSHRRIEFVDVDRPGMPISRGR